MKRKKILKDDFNIKISRDMRKELDDMGGLMQPVIDIAVKQAVKKNTKKVTKKVATETDKLSKLEAIRNAMQSWGLSAEEAMKGLKISPALQIELKPLL